MARTSDITYNIFCDMDQECRFARIGHEDLTDKTTAQDMGHAHMAKNPTHQIFIEQVSRHLWRLV